MLAAQVDISQMFRSYTAISESRHTYSIRCAHCGQEFRLPARTSICDPVHAFCPQCRTYINYGWSKAAADNAWIAQEDTAPVDMHLQLRVYKDSVQLGVYGRGISPLSWDASRYWHRRSYREEFRFDVKARKTTWTRYVGSQKAEERELGDPGELVALAKISMLRYLYTHPCIADHKPSVIALLRRLRDAVHERLERRVRHKVSSLFCPSGTYAGWLLLPLGNIAYRMVFKDAPNLPRVWRYLGSSRTGELDSFRTIIEGFDLNAVRRAKDTVTGIIAASGLPDTRSVRRALTKDVFCLRRLVFLHQLFTRSDIAMQALPLFSNHTHGDRTGYPLEDKLMLLKDMYAGVDILRFLRHSRDWYLVQDTVNMLNVLGDAARRELIRRPPRIRDLHDTLVQIRRRETHPDYAFDNDIAPIRRRLAMQMVRIRFILPERSQELYDAGDALHNCVGSYADQVRDGKTHIILMADDRGKLTACIEVKDGTIRQAKLDCNRSVAQKTAINNAVVAWAQRVGLRYDTCPDIKPPTSASTATAATA